VQAAPLENSVVVHCLLVESHVPDWQFVSFVHDDPLATLAAHFAEEQLPDQHCVEVEQVDPLDRSEEEHFKLIASQMPLLHLL
jgi:hypothetical protein